MILTGTHACRRTHMHSKIISRRRFYIFSQSIEMHRHARVVSVLVRNINAICILLLIHNCCLAPCVCRYKDCSPEWRACSAYLLPLCWQKDMQNLRYIVIPALLAVIPVVSFGKHATQTILSKPTGHSCGQWGNYCSAKQTWPFGICWLASLSLTYICLDGPSR